MHWTKESRLTQAIRPPVKHDTLLSYLASWAPSKAALEKQAHNLSLKLKKIFNNLKRQGRCETMKIKKRRKRKRKKKRKMNKKEEKEK